MQLLAKIFYIKGSYKVYVLIEDLLSCFLVVFFFPYSQSHRADGQIFNAQSLLQKCTDINNT